jgi:hypothetical protein
MNKKQKSLSNPKIGMSRARSPYLLEENAYTFMLNGQSVDESGNKLTLSNEHSNILASKFKDGFIVLGLGNDIIADKTYFLLHNPTTGVSEFGCISNNRNFTQSDDEYNATGCTDCDNSNTISTPLEEQIQVPHQSYTTLIEDSCNLCLNLHPDFPVRDIIIKRENIGTIAVFADDRNEPRYIELDDLEQYKFEGEDICDQGNQTPTCLDCDKLRIFKLYKYPTTTSYERVLGGSLKMGMYEVMFAYSDQLGNELSSYTSLAAPVSIFDENNIVRPQAENSAETSFAIRYTLEDLDQRYTHYKIAVIYTSGETISAGVSTEYVLGVYSTSNNNIILADNNGNGEGITKNEILIPKRSVKSWKGLTESNGILFGYGIKENETINLQPVVNLMGLAMKWQSTIAKEDLYAEANANQYKGYNRDEVVPFGIQPVSCDGYVYPIYPLIPKPATATELEPVDNKDTQSILNSVSDCDGTLRDKRWQFYNTGFSEGFCESDVETVPQTETITAITSVQVPSVPAGSIDLTLSEAIVFTNLEDFIEQNLDSCDDPGTSPIQDICPYIDLGNLSGFNNPPTTEPDCTPFTLEGEAIDIEEVVNESSVFNEKPIGDYSRLAPSQTCVIHELDNTTNQLRRDDDFAYAYNVDSYIPVPPALVTPIVNVSTLYRIPTIYNTTCGSALNLLRVNSTNIGISNYGAFYHLNLGADTVAELQTSKTVSATSGTRFTPNLHKGALWFKTERDGRDKFFLEIPQETACDRSAVAEGSEVRVSIFDTCASNSSSFSTIVDLSSHQFIEIDSVLLDSLSTDDLFIAIDVPIVESEGYGDGWDPSDFVNPPTTRYRLAPLCGCFNIVDREQEFTSVTVSYDEIVIFKNQRYESECTFNVPVLDDCRPVPYEFGEFGYYESIEKYPDNSELYNSSNLDIRPSDFLNIDFRTKFENTYTTATGTSYTLDTDETNFVCKNIRHYRMPDNNTTSFMSSVPGGSTSDAVIYPLGVTIDNSVINSFLNIAVRNNLITQERRDNIVGYKIHRGDSTLYRSIQGSGLLYDLKKATRDGKEYHFSNFPYNAGGGDKLYLDVESSTDENYLWTLHTPETDYFRPGLATEMSVQGYQRGRSLGFFDAVEDHEKFTILGSAARSLATTLAIIEVTAEVVIASAQALSNAQVWIVGGFTNGASIGTPAYVAAGIIGGLGILSGGIANVGRYRYEWLKNFRDLGTPENFGYYYSSVGKYNQFTSITSVEDNLRGLSLRKYLKEGIFTVQDNQTAEQITINNLDRERSVILSSSSDYTLQYDPTYFAIDNNTTNPTQSSQPIASEGICTEGLSEEFNRKIASLYVSLKNYISNQYGTINSVSWIDTNYQGMLDKQNDCDFILGGDTFICRHTVKRKMRMFRTDAFNVADLTPFAYKLLSNVSNVRFYIDYEVLSQGSVGSTLFPNIDYDVQTDCGKSTGSFYVEPPKKFYLYYYGHPDFLTETRINTNFRNARKEPWEQFYPQNLDYLNLTQEKNVSIRRPNRFFYNNVYSFPGTSFTNVTLPDYFSQEDFDRQNDNRNTVMYSRPDVNENSLTEPWLNYRPNDYYVFPASNGELRALKGIENNQVLGTFDDRTVVFNAVDVFVNGIDQSNSELGTGGIFAKRPRTFSETDLGYVGSQNTQILSTEFGHFIVDAKRGQIFRIQPNAQSLEEISRYSGGKPNGMDVWFKEHLPFKILRDFPDFSDYIDNNFAGLGITMGWDSKYRRVIITKKDYRATEGLSYVGNGVFEDTQTNQYTIQEAINNGLLRDISWTITYKPEKGGWESYMDYKPNYYISHSDYFQSGVNVSSDSSETGLWSHLLTNRSKQVFYGNKYPWIIEYPTKHEYVNKDLQGISLWTEAKRYHNEYDYAPDERVTFNKAVIFSDRENSHNLNLIVNNGTLSQLSNYPITNSDSQDILISQHNKKWSFNHFYNRVKSNRNNIPPFLWDDNQINKTVNLQAVSFYSKSVLEHMSSEVFLVRLTQDKTSQYDLELKFTMQTEEIDNQ